MIEAPSLDAIKNSVDNEYRVLRVYTPQIYKHWDKIKEAFLESVGSFGRLEEADFVRIQHMLLAGQIQLLVLLKGEEQEVHAVAVYAVMVDNVVGARFATVYAFKAFHTIGKRAWRACVDGLIRYAREDNAQRVHMIMSNRAMINLFKSEGFNVDNTLAVLEIGA